MSKWQLDGSDPAGRIQVGKFNKALGRLAWEASTYVERYGVVGGEERRMTYTAICGGTRDDVTAFKTALGEKYNWTVSRSNVNEIIAAIDAGVAELAKTRPVKDTRKTAEQVAADDKAIKAAEAKREADGNAARQGWIRLYGKPNGETVEIPAGHMAVTVALHYDGSDMMTDYYNPHVMLSPSFAVLVVPKQAQTEALARRALALLPAEVQGLEWTWNTEKYSGGHGNYLQSQGFELPQEVQDLPHGGQYYRGGKVTHACWEIQFCGDWRRDALLKHAVCGTEPTPTAGPQGPVAGVTVTENQAKGGVEIRFPAKPDEATLTSLKANGWRWSRFAHCWYHRADDRARAFAHGLAGTTTGTTNADDHSGEEDRECGDRAYEDACARACGM